MRFGLITPLTTGPRSNQGWHFMTAGIRHLFRKAIPEASFVHIGMFTWNEYSDLNAKACDMLVLCGNPRYHRGNGQEWLYAGLLGKMLDTGVPCVDAWAGASGRLRSEDDIKGDAAKLLSYSRNCKIIDHLKDFKAIITRDRRAQYVNEISKLNSIELPCSSWWAVKEYNVAQSDRTIEGVFVSFESEDKRIKDITKSTKYRVISTLGTDHEWCGRNKIKSELVADPVSLLSLFAKCKNVISIRLHSAIPAGSMGCAVSMVGVDTRAQACDHFQIPWDYYDAPKPRVAVEPADPTDKIRALLL